MGQGRGKRGMGINECRLVVEVNACSCPRVVIRVVFIYFRAVGGFVQWWV